MQKTRRRVTTTHTDILWTDRTPPAIMLFVDGFSTPADEYTEAQFDADLHKSRKVLDKLAREAVEEHERGETEDFPCED